MASAKSIVMNWTNQTNTVLNFLVPQPPTHGNSPLATPSVVDPPGGSVGNTSAVEATPFDPLFGPGPEGFYQWKLGESENTVGVSYNHPFGTSTTTVQVSCPDGVLVAGCGQGPAQSISLGTNCSSLQSTDATVDLVLTLA